MQLKILTNTQELDHLEILLAVDPPRWVEIDLRHLEVLASDPNYPAFLAGELLILVQARDDDGEDFTAILQKREDSTTFSYLVFNNFIDQLIFDKAPRYCFVKPELIQNLGALNPS